MRLTTMRGPIFWISACLIFVAFQYMIVSKERILTSGHRILLELAPLDPRSLMQGDYMRLNYELNNTLRNIDAPAGTMVVRPDEQHIARFVRFGDATPLADGDYLIRFDSSPSRPSGPLLKPDSFFFQEGHAKRYESAIYGVFQCENKGMCLLVGLAGRDGQLIPLVSEAAIPPK